MATPDMITLSRSTIARATGSKIQAIMLLEMARKEKPYMYPVIWDIERDEIWNVEKQWWLKHKEVFKAIGFLPINAYNNAKKIPQMLEKY